MRWVDMLQEVHMPIKIFSPGLVLHHRVVGVGVQGCGEGKQGRRARGCIIPVSSFWFLIAVYAAVARRRLCGYPQLSPPRDCNSYLKELGSAPGPAAYFTEVPSMGAQSLSA